MTPPDTSASEPPPGQPTSSDPIQHSLDPADWHSLRALGHQMLDDLFDNLAALREQPVWRPLPDTARAALAEPLPRQGQGAEAAYQHFVERVLPYPTGNLHPRFFGWVQGCGTPLSMLADLLAAGLNPHLAGLNQAPPLVERQTIAWLAELMGLPPTASGILVSGATMANVLGLAVARQAKAGFDVREAGLQDGEQPRLIVYGSAETHNCVVKGLELLGLGRRAFRAIPVDADYRLDIARLRAAVAADQAAGHRPIAVVGTAGTVNTGAIDNLAALADLCAEHNLWFHVDSAFGGLVRLSPKLRHMTTGIERADSIAFDLHKWMSLTYEVACLLVRDPMAHHDAFATEVSYLQPTDRGLSAGGMIFADRGIELTRGFKALKVWLSLKAHGADAFARQIEQNVEQTRYLVELIERHPRLERLAPAPLNIVCFRYAPPDVPADQLNALNQEIVMRLQESGEAVTSSTILNGAYAIRAALVSHRSRFEDIRALVASVTAIGDQLIAEARE